jgi:hypothetical protein
VTASEATRSDWDDATTLREARTRFVEECGYDEPSYSAWFAPAALGPFPLLPKWFRIWIPFPNTAGRRRTIALHDLHHILTGYPVDWTGEAQISAWEVASGGIDRWNVAGHFFLAHVMVFGLVCRNRLFRAAWRRGRACTNLFRRELDDDLLALTIAEARRELGLLTAPAAPPER